MRRPCLPISQSIGFDIGSKSVRRVTPHSKEESSRRVMGTKRESSKALLSCQYFRSAVMYKIDVLRGQSVAT